MSLIANIRLGWKGLLGTNALAYYEKSYLTTVKRFITLAPDHRIGNYTVFNLGRLLTYKY